jgi:putative phage-type endonuclease
MSALEVTTPDAEWHAWRALGIGASEAEKCRTAPWAVWAGKVGLTRPTEHTERQQIGLDLEAAIARMFHRTTGLYVAGEQTWCVHPEHDWMRCTVDGFAVESGGILPDDALGVVEIKTDGRFGWPDGVPRQYWSQVQWQLAVTGLDRAWLAVLFAGFRFEVIEIARDDVEIDALVDAASALWHNHVLTGVPPEVDGSDWTRQALAEAYPAHVKGKEVALDGAVQVIDLRDRLKAEIKIREDTLAAAENTLRALIADAEIATVDRLPVLTLRTRTRSGLDGDALEADFGAELDRYRTTSTFRVLAPPTKKDLAS